MRFFWATIEKVDVHVDPKRRVCGKEVESVGHVASGCTGFVPSIGGDMIGWELCRKYGVKCADVW